MKRTIRELGCVFALALATGLGHAASAAAPTLSLSTHVQTGAESSSFWDVNNAGTVVGYSVIGGLASPFTWSVSGGFVTLALPDGASAASASGITDAGVIVGNWSKFAGTDPGTGDPLYEQRGFVRDAAGGYANFEIVGATNTWLRAISPDGRYLSGYYDAAGTAGQGFVHDTVSNTTTFIGAGGNDFTIAQGVSNAGVVVGSDVLRDDATGATLGRPGWIFDLASGTRTDVDLPGAPRTAFRAIDSAGGIAGWTTGGSGYVGFHGYPAAVELITWPGPDMNLYIEGSNDPGWLVGSLINSLTGQQQALLAMPVPEPASALLLGAGLAGIGAWRRRAAARQPG